MGLGVERRVGLDALLVVVCDALGNPLEIALTPAGIARKSMEVLRKLAKNAERP